MTITENTKLKDILTEYPWLKEELLKRSSRAKLLFGPLGKRLRETGTIGDLSRKMSASPDELIEKLQQLIEEHQEQN